MKRNLLLVTLLPVLGAAPCLAQELTRTVTWQASASKNSQSTVTLLHPGQQLIASQTPVLAAQITSPNSGLRLQARALAKAPKVTLNGKTLTTHYQAVPATEQYYLSYQLQGQQPGSITESGYDLVAYWQY